MTVFDKLNNKRDIYFVSFADSKLRESLKRIRKQARQFKCIKRVYIYNEKRLPRYARKRVEEIIRQTNSRRGYGYWSWKPAVIQAVLDKIQFGDILFYADAGCHLNARGESRFLTYVDRAIKHDIWVTQLDETMNDLNYTKRDTVSLFEKYNLDFNALRSGQIQPGVIILIKNEYTSWIISQWNEMMSVKNIHYFDDSPSILPNDPSFIENRHDQSLFSLLLKCHHFYPDKDCHCYAETEEGWAKLSETEPILVKRDKQWSVGFWKSFKRGIKSFLKKLFE